MDITIYLICFNEEVLIPNTLDHYYKRFPKAKIIILDNESTDRSVEIALARGCEVVSWKSKNEANIIILTDLKNSVWKTAETDWVIIADMDEWAEICEADLIDENAKGSTILHFKGIQVVAESESLTLDDIDLHGLKRGYPDVWFNKHVCFKRSAITEMNYTRGCHKSAEKGLVKYSKRVYILKHMNFLGFPWYQAKMKARYARTYFNRNKLRCSGHYMNDDASIIKRFNQVKAAAKDIL